MEIGPLPRWRGLLHPLNLAGLLTWLAVAFTLRYGEAAQLPWRWGCAAVFLAAFLVATALPHRTWRRKVLLLVEAVSALALIRLAHYSGVAPALLVMLAAQIAATWPLRITLLLIAAVNVGMYLVLRDVHAHAGAVVLIFAGFQAFAMLTTHYAHSAEQARDRLALVNADLLATRALLAESSRDAERLRLSRELHDVAGHKLTALRLQLRALAGRSDAPAELTLCEQLSAELLGDIRAVVHSLRDGGQLDIATALHALAAPLPRPRLHLAMDEAVQVSTTAKAETLLRCVQEALTNSARHGEAQVLQVTLHQHEGRLLLDMHDDGRLRGQLREGNGLTGMRERVAEQHGTLELQRTATGALHIHVELPA
ncbi:sensor histidine kinase [Stenotrophomonas sp. STM01]|uniref:sensor histidine kinase n=1 Tax=Stenotrophomonas sp. STM01 TaxID=2769278 RepID=UPI00177E14AA|nr:histidine kinase [Stenotrophomonas sp. STM01]MBD9537551.1 sensor histidine kinase [Stenotrophomonas sp. STM01]